MHHRRRHPFNGTPTWFQGKSMKKAGLVSLCLALLVSLAGCDAISSEPTYDGLSVEGFNYTPYNLSRFVVTDKYGNRASGGGDLPPGSGAGRLSCCYSLKGTEFTVDWRVYDVDEGESVYAPIKYIEKKTEVHLPPTEVKGGPGTRILGLHFYPDDHVEFEFRTDLRGSRIDFSEVNYRLKKKYPSQINPGGEEGRWTDFRRVAKIAAEGWMKYHLADSDDLEQYVYYTLLVNKDFDQHPVVQKIISSTKGKPGEFARELKALPEATRSEIKASKFEHVKTEASNG